MTGGVWASASDDVSSVATVQAVAAIAILLAVSAAAAWWIARRQRDHPGDQRSASAWFVGFAALSLIVAVTLLRDGLPSELDLGGLAHWSADGLRVLRRDPLGSSGFVLNIVLFVPAGAAWTWIVSRPVVVLLGLAAMTAAIESIQAVTFAGAADVADLVANSIGAAIGVAAAELVPRALGRSVPRLTRRAQLITAAAVAAVVVLAVGGWFAGAARHQQDVEDDLRRAFTGTDRAAIESLLDEDPSSVFGAVDGFADGTRYTDDSVEIRYPATFLSLDRCVFVRWTEAGVEFRKSSGQDCTEFIDG